MGPRRGSSQTNYESGASTNGNAFRPARKERVGFAGRWLSSLLSFIAVVKRARGTSNTDHSLRSIPEGANKVGLPTQRVEKNVLSLLHVTWPTARITVEAIRSAQ